MDKAFYVSQIEEHSGLLYRVALSILSNDEDCKDALQEAAQKAWEKRHTLREERYFATWVVRILINECHNLKRKSRRVVLVERLAESEDVTSQDNTTWLVLDSLPEKYRIPLVLRYSEGMNECEIAKVLRLPSSTIRGRLHRGKQMLRKELEE